MQKILLPLIYALAAALPPATLAAGPAPADVYLDFHATLKRSLGESALWPYYTQAAREEFERKYPPQLRGKVFYMMKTTSPAQVRVTDEVIRGDAADLTLQPTDGGRMVGTANLRLENGQWRLEKVIWQQR